ncbi:hypothetical protein Q4Q35_15930 [Flavivirga aquimarina]|uniref:DUF1735 domain-containing protein n=1 Tax=Flavivirga aquimarina TaxID=2027862 RepID=A0ABT8WDV9_9FLAO|nr:hypothetical protein [Flavivirga aquimarina]MDO5971298.1 hypothetical protein [Flavivirga aquimarina]
MKKILYILTIVLSLSSVLSCEKNDDSPIIININYVGFESGFILGSDPIGTASEEVRIAASNTTNSDRTFNIVIDADLTTADPSAYSFPSTVTIPANTNLGSFVVEVNGENINALGDDILAIKFVSDEENLLISDPISLNLRQVCPNPEVVLDITFDDFPGEIYWAVLDSGDNIVFESADGGAYGAYSGEAGEMISRSLCILQSGIYTFQIQDQYADGAGPFTISYDGSIIFSSDGVYGGGVETEFTVN